MKSFLFVLEGAAYSGSDTQEALDVILITAAFDQEVSILLLGEAIYHLKKQQNTKDKCCKNIGSIYRSLGLYDVENIYIQQSALSGFGLTTDDLLLPVSVCNQQEIVALMSQFDFVING